MNERANILIVDDEPFNIAVLEQELEDLGYDTWSAANGQEALDLIAGRAPDLVLLDIRMPIMDGFTMLARLKADPATRDIPVIVISANNDLASTVRGIEQGAEDYLPKPFEPVLLAARISTCLEKKRLRDQELEYLREVERLTAAAAAIENNSFDERSLDGVAARPDALGSLARVFQRMAREVHAREQRLRRQLQQVQLDLEEHGRAAAETVAAYLPMDRRQALARGAALPLHSSGAALIADLSGFTPLAEALAHDMGLQRGAEELNRQLNRVYDMLLAEVHRYGGSVIGFAGDSITCWFASQGLGVGDQRLARQASMSTPDPQPSTPAALRAAACAVAMQSAVERLGAMTTPSGAAIVLAIKVAVGAGPARRMLVGDPDQHQIEVLAGRALDEVARAEQAAGGGEVLATEVAVAACGDALLIDVWREEPATHERFAVIGGLAAAVPEAPWPELSPDSISAAQARPWLLPPVYERVRAGKSAFLSELRPAAALFLAFHGLDYDTDDQAEARLNTFVRWVQRVLARYDGALVQVTIGDKGNYLYAAFGAPVAHEDDAARTVACARELHAPPKELRPITIAGIGATYGQMYAGAYGSAAQRTYGLLGDKTNVAARLMQAAEADILCDAALVRAAGPAFVFDELPAISVKGKAEPVAVYRPLAYMAQRIASRIDQLGPDYQLTLKIASAIGPVFTVGLLCELYPIAIDPAQLDANLETLEQLGLLIQRADVAEPTYAFGDTVLWQTNYHRLPFAQRRMLHRTIAEWYECAYAHDLTPHYALLARHWRLSEEPAKAIGYLERAGEAARARGDHAAALAYFDESLALSAQAAVLSDDYTAGE